MGKRARSFGLTAKSVVLAIAIHGLVGLIIMVHFTWDTGAVAQLSKQAEPLQATIVDVDPKAEKERKKQEELEAKQQAEEAKKQRELEQKKLAELERKRKEEEQKIAEAEKQRKQTEAKALAEKKKKEEEAKAIAEKKRKEEEQRKKEEQLKLAKLEKEKEEKRKAEELQKKKEAEEQARRDEEKRRQEAELQDRLNAERLERRAASEFAKYRALIQQTVSRNWTRPSNARTGLIAKVLVTVTPSGEVISAEVTNSSGNPIFDRSVENAILKASPLPIPRDRELYDHFRQFIFKFNPDEGLIS